MREYFSALLTAAVIGGLFTFLSGTRMEKYMKYTVSLVCVALLVIPLKNVFAEFGPDDFGEGGSFDVSFAEYADGKLYAEEEAEKEGALYVENLVCEKFGIKPLNVVIEIDWSERDALIKSVTVTVPYGADVSAVKDHLDRTLGGDINVVCG